MKTTDQYKAILKEFYQERGTDYGIRKIGIFGSVARGNQRDGSDIDIYYEGKALSLFK